jgi:hypothetical protein
VSALYDTGFVVRVPSWHRWRTWSSMSTPAARSPSWRQATTSRSSRSSPARGRHRHRPAAFTGPMVASGRGRVGVALVPPQPEGEGPAHLAASRRRARPAARQGHQDGEPELRADPELGALGHPRLDPLGREHQQGAQGELRDGWRARRRRVLLRHRVPRLPVHDPRRRLEGLPVPVRHVEARRHGLAQHRRHERAHRLLEHASAWPRARRRTWGACSRSSTRAT